MIFYRQLSCLIRLNGEHAHISTISHLYIDYIKSLNSTTNLIRVQWEWILDNAFVCDTDGQGSKLVAGVKCAIVSIYNVAGRVLPAAVHDI